MTKSEFKQIFKNTILSEGFSKIIESETLVSPHFPDVFNLSAGHQFVLPTLHSPTRVPVSSQAIIQWCVRKDDISRVGYTKHHLSSFEMAVFGDFGYITNKEQTQVKLLGIFLQIMAECGIDKSQLYFSISDGAQILDTYLPFDQTSYRALQALGIKESHIIRTKGRQNFVFSNGQDRASGYNIEIFYMLNGTLLEIASSNIYEYVVSGEHLLKKENIGIGVGIGIERLLMIVNNYRSIYQTLDINLERYSQALGGDLQTELAKSKIYRIEDLSRTVRLIENLVFAQDVPVNYKQMKEYKFIKAHLGSELRYLEIL